MTMYLGIALANAPSTSPLAAPVFRDDFTDAGSGNINGRTGWTVGYLSGSSAQANAITIASGKAGGTTGTGMFAGTSASIALPVVKRRRAITQIPAGTLIDHATLTTTGVPSLSTETVRLIPVLNWDVMRVFQNPALTPTNSHLVWAIGWFTPRT